MVKVNFGYDISYTQNRELSWLKFNQRVLEEGEDPNVPLLERLKFLSIFISNLDEFFMIRVGSLYDLSLIKKETYENKSGLSPKEQLDAVYKAVRPLYAQKDKAFFELEAQLREYDIYNLNIEELLPGERKFMDSYFKKNVMPLLSPQIIDSRHPFPHLWNKSLYIIANLKVSDKLSTVGIISVPYSVPKILTFPGNSFRYIMMEKIILHYYDSVFDKYAASNKCIISVTRNADISPEDEAFDFDEDFRAHMKMILKKRSRLAPVRLEVQGSIDKKLVKYLVTRLEIKESQIYKSKSPLLLDYSFDLGDELPLTTRRNITYKNFESQYPASLDPNERITIQCRKKDILLFYPYEQIEPFIQLLKESANDHSVKSIKMTLYRLASKSRIIEHLCDAAEKGKDVTVLIELRARFDEKNNIEWAERLEQSGCKVIYGFEDFKVHSKICLITSREKNKISYITQIGTGNYNEKTAKLYTDLSLITADQEIGKDANDFFKNMSISNLDGTYSRLLVAPSSFQDKIEELIDEEIFKAEHGYEGRVIFKANSLTERVLIDKLSVASQAGVKVDLIIRGICCLLPGIEGKTENITVTSIVGRYLEHPRVYCFGIGKDTKIYISSADLMTRNIVRRVEIACPILDPDIKQRILHMLDVMLKDNVKAKVLQSDGNYVKKTHINELPVDSQKYFMDEVMAANTGDGSRPKKESTIRNDVLKFIIKKLGKYLKK
ncbi:MAG: polyphosphate kinase 1 [Eubacteriaceae bacterium]|nr:polyphosphate kinase 1 [Eubacteriaceae bacterium]